MIDIRPPARGDGFNAPSTATDEDRPAQAVTGRAVDERIAALAAEVESLRAEAERTRLLLDSATAYAVITLSLSGRVTSWNAGARAILGYGDADILGRSGEVLFPAEDRAGGVFVNELRRAMEQGCAVNERWHLRRDGSRFWASGSMTPLRDGDGRAEGYLNVFRDNTARRAEEERQALLFAEMGHRLRNTLATVQAVAAQTFRTAEVPRDLRESFAARLLALAQSHNLLIRGDWEGASLAELVERTLAPYGGFERAKISGPSVQLPAGSVEMLCLAFHELATNAAKHGALSVPEGEVEVRWSLRQTEGRAASVEIAWLEKNGPPVIPPANRGFGSRLLEHGLVHSFGGTVQLEFPATGTECHICLPIAARTEKASLQS